MLICYHFPQFLGLSLINPSPLRDDVIKRLANQWAPPPRRCLPSKGGVAFVNLLPHSTLLFFQLTLGTTEQVRENLITAVRVKPVTFVWAAFVRLLLQVGA